MALPLESNIIEYLRVLNVYFKRFQLFIKRTKKLSPDHDHTHHQVIRELCQKNLVIACSDQDSLMSDSQRTFSHA